MTISYRLVYCTITLLEWNLIENRINQVWKRVSYMEHWKFQKWKIVIPMHIATVEICVIKSLMQIHAAGIISLVKCWRLKHDV